MNWCLRGIEPGGGVRIGVWERWDGFGWVGWGDWGMDGLREG